MLFAYGSNLHFNATNEGRQQVLKAPATLRSVPGSEIRIRALSFSQTVLVKDSGEPWHPSWLGLDPIEDVEDGIMLGQDQFEALLNAETGYLGDLDNEVISTSRRYETAAMSGTGQLVAIERDTHDIYYFPSLSDALSPTYVPTILLNPSSSPILQLVAGASHFLFLTSTSVLSYGDNRFSQCGTHSSVPVSTTSLSIIDFFEGLQPTMIAAGDLHSCVITNGGALYTFGADMTGQCGGFGGEPTLVNLKPDEEDEDPDEVISVACGSQHTVLVTTLGQVWSSGLNKHGQLGLGSTTTCKSFTRLDLFENRGDAIDAQLGAKEVQCSRWTTFIRT